MKKMKKLILSLLIVTVVAQLFVPSYMIWERYSVTKIGQEVKFLVQPIDPYDAFRGRYVSLSYDYDLSFSQRNGKYGIVKIGDDGFARISSVTNTKPKNELYIVSNDNSYFYIPHNRYYMQ